MYNIALDSFSVETEVGPILGLALIADDNDSAIEIAECLRKSEPKDLRVEFIQNGILSFSLDIDVDEQLIKARASDVADSVLRDLGIASRNQKFFFLIAAVKTRGAQGYSLIYPEDELVYKSDLFVNGANKVFDISSPWPEKIRLTA